MRYLKSTKIHTISEDKERTMIAYNVIDTLEGLWYTLWRISEIRKRLQGKRDPQPQRSRTPTEDHAACTIALFLMVELAARSPDKGLILNQQDCTTDNGWNLLWPYGQSLLFAIIQREVELKAAVDIANTG